MTNAIVVTITHVGPDPSKAISVTKAVAAGAPKDSVNEATTAVRFAMNQYERVVRE